MNTFVGEAYDSVGEVCIFLLNNFTLPPGKALAIYIQSPGSLFLYCGAVTLTRPSVVFYLCFGRSPAANCSSRHRIPSLYPPKSGFRLRIFRPCSLDVTAKKKIERLGMKVGENLFNFMQSFCGVNGSKLVVPMDILDRWLRSFRSKQNGTRSTWRVLLYIC